MVVLAAWNRFALHPRLERDALGISPGGISALAALRTSIRAEVVLAALVMVSVAVLVSIPPPL
jgi:putative copper export protein